MLSRFNKRLEITAGAAVLGIIGAAGMYIMEKYRQDKMRNGMARDIARLEKEMRQLKTDLHQLQSQKSAEVDQQRRSKRAARARKANSVTSDEYLSTAADSSDGEFYDVSDDEDFFGNSTNTLDSKLIELDRKMDLGQLEDVKDALNLLEDLCLEHPGNSELLFRIGKAHHKIADASDNKELVEAHLAKGIEACSAALNIAPENANVHKWYAVLIGSRSELVPLKEKINDGHLFKKHVDIAISLSPEDYSLHYMLGRFEFEIAKLKWYERKVAAALFGEPPNSTFEEACTRFMEAERLATFDWKDNRLMIGKCKIAMGEYGEAAEWLERASQSRSTSLDEKIDMEIDELLEKYRSNK